MRRIILVLFLLMFLLPACGVVAPGSIKLTPGSLELPASPGSQSIDLPSVTPPEPTDAPATPTVTSTPTSTPTPVPITPTSTLTACLRAGGRVEVYEFTTLLLPDPLVYRIYLPPCYDEDPGQSYPVLYLVHGQTYSDTQWDRLGVPETADRLIQSGGVVPFIVVMPRDRVWLEPTEDNFGKAVKQALVPWIDEHYRTIPDREHRAIGGLSRGAAWAVNIGLSNWDTFSKVGVHSGFAFISDTQNIYLWLHNTPTGFVPQIYMDSGEDERPEIARGSSWLEDLLTRLDVPHEWHLFTGEHEEAYWQSHVEDYLRWYTQDW